MNTKQLAVLWFAAIAAAIVLSLAPGAREDFHPYFVLAGIIVIAATLIYTLRPHPNAKIRLLWLTVGIPILVITGWLVITYYFSQLPPPPSAPLPTPVPPAPPVRASGENFRQVDRSLVEPYSFTLSDNGQVLGWIRNKSFVPIDAVAVHVEIKNFAGDTISSETHTVMTQIPPNQAKHVGFLVSSSPAQNGLLNYSPTLPNVTEHFDPGAYLESKEVNPFDKFAPSPIVKLKLNWSWHMQIEAAGSNKR